MVRTQVQLTESQHRLLREEAHRRGVSMSELVRCFVDDGLHRARPDRAELFHRARALKGAFTPPAGETDLAAGHDEYLDEAFS